jgi:hypothetical protein
MRRIEASRYGEVLKAREDALDVIVAWPAVDEAGNKWELTGFL